MEKYLQVHSQRILLRRVERTAEEVQKRWEKLGIAHLGPVGS